MSKLIAHKDLPLPEEAIGAITDYVVNDLHSPLRSDAPDPEVVAEWRERLADGLEAALSAVPAEWLLARLPEGDLDQLRGSVEFAVEEGYMGASASSRELLERAVAYYGHSDPEQDGPRA